MFQVGPGGPLWSEYVTTTNFHYQPLFFREILYSLIRNKINTSELQFRKSRSTVPKTTYFLPLGPHNDIFQKSGDNVRFLIGELLLWLIVGIASSFGSGGESRAGCVSTLVSISGCTDCTGVQIAFWSMITPLSFTLSSECTIEKVFEKVFAKTQTAPPLHQYLPLPVISYAPRDSLSEWLWRAGSSLGTLVLKLFCVTCYTPMHVTAWLMLPEMLEHQKSSWSIQLQYKHLKPWNLQPFNLCQLEYCEQVWLIEHPSAWNIWREAQNVKNHEKLFWDVPSLGTKQATKAGGCASGTNVHWCCWVEWCWLPSWLLLTAAEHSNQSAADDWCKLLLISEDCCWCQLLLPADNWCWLLLAAIDLLLMIDFDRP